MISAQNPRRAGRPSNAGARVGARSGDATESRGASCGHGWSKPTMVNKERRRQKLEADFTLKSTAARGTQLTHSHRIHTGHKPDSGPVVAAEIRGMPRKLSGLRRGRAKGRCYHSIQDSPLCLPAHEHNVRACLLQAALWLCLSES